MEIYDVTVNYDLYLHERTKLTIPVCEECMELAGKGAFVNAEAVSDRSRLRCQEIR
jgi:hypothetical protein